MPEAGKKGKGKGKGWKGKGKGKPKDPFFDVPDLFKQKTVQQVPAGVCKTVWYARLQRGPLEISQGFASHSSEIAARARPFYVSRLCLGEGEKIVVDERILFFILILPGNMA